MNIPPDIAATLPIFQRVLDEGYSPKRALVRACLMRTRHREAARELYQLIIDHLDAELSLSEPEQP